MMSNWKETLKMALPWSMSNSSQAASIVSIQNEHNSCPKGLVICRGGMIFTFFKAEGISVGKSLVEDDQLELAKKVKAAAEEKGVEFLLPVDVVLADNFAEDANTKTTDVNSIPDGWMVSQLKGYLLQSRKSWPSFQIKQVCIYYAMNSSLSAHLGKCMAHI